MGFLTASLHLFSEFSKGKATENLLGRGVLPKYLNDTRTGRVLDKLYEYGVTKVFVTIAITIVQNLTLPLNIAI